ncbi:MAG: hypothetical protein LBU14_03955 [Candidatus Peribacteria bacterium]|jgi:hypothetical protein|nr:hypothetical protein [Candidatus Peribacteria bacterium]
MKKILVFLTLIILTLSVTNADYIQDSIEYFKNAPNFADLEKIEDENLRYCEEVFLMVYMRRNFTEEENNECRELFAKRIEAEMIYKKYVLENRGVY